MDNTKAYEIYTTSDYDNHTIKIPKEIGHWSICNGHMLVVVTEPRKKPRWLTRFLLKWLIEWEWKDELIK